MRRRLSSLPSSKRSFSHFFHGELRRFKVERLERVEFVKDKKTGKEKPRDINKLDITPILNKIGEGMSLFSLFGPLADDG